jgi:hypothetical protein
MVDAIHRHRTIAIANKRTPRGLISNVHYNDRPVSLFGGMVDLPLIVTRPDGRRFFDETERDTLTDGKLWAEFDAEHASAVATLERDLRLNLSGDAAWTRLEPEVRVFIALGMAR